MTRVLLFGYMEDLLRKRHDALCRAGLEVTSVNSRNAALRLLENEQFDVVVVGHRVPSGDRNDVAMRARLARESRVIFLYRWSIRDAEPADALLNVDGNPQDLVAAIQRLASPADRSAAPAND